MGPALTTAAAVADINRQIANGNAVAGAVTSSANDGLSRQTDVASQVQIIVAAAADQAANSANTSTDQSKISAAESAISGDLTHIQTDIGTLSSDVLTLKNAAAAISGDFASITQQVAQTYTSGTSQVANPAFADVQSEQAFTPRTTTAGATGGALGLLSNSLNDLVSENTTLAAAVPKVNSAVVGLETNSANPTNAGPTNSVGQWAALLLADNQAVANDLGGGSATGRQSYVINVGVEPNGSTVPIVPRLGNVNITGNLLVGNGSLVAPGNASIKITNNTGDTLDLEALLAIPTYDAGHLRFNGVLVNSSNDINALNAIHPAPLYIGSNTANFSSIKTASTGGQGASVTITSNYNSGDPNYYSPCGSLPCSKPAHLAQLQPAPDIQVNGGISNPEGRVSIASSSGNIYVNSKIAAGSLSIIAQNGDFVASYVDGFDNVGGDPASQNPLTVNGVANQTGLGVGIIANGSVVIAARYLNINSTIQSGIAEWNANLTGSGILRPRIRRRSGSRSSRSTTPTRSIRTNFESGDVSKSEPVFPDHRHRHRFRTVSSTLSPSSSTRTRAAFRSRPCKASSTTTTRRRPTTSIRAASTRCR